MFIRNIRNSDYEAVDRLLLQLHQLDVTERPELFSAVEHYMTKESFISLVESKSVMTILAQEGSMAVGCCFVSILERSGMAAIKTAYIDLIVVDEQHRRKGIGRALFQEVRKRSKRIGAKRIDLMVWSHNPIAIRAYEAYGMRPQRCVYEMRI